VSTHVEAERRDGSGAWWLRALLVPQAPVPVFAALRDDSREAAEDRQEPLSLAAYLNGLALTVLSPTAASFADDPVRGGIAIPAWLFIAGLFVALINFWVGGGALYLACNLLGGKTSYRQARHLLALAGIPIVFSLVLLPVRLALYGDDIFRSGGADAGSAKWIFTALALAFAAWSVGLLVIGLRTLERWSWGRSVAAMAAFLALVVLSSLALQLFG
jgi:hypothetical protein